MTHLNVTPLFLGAFAVAQVLLPFAEAAEERPGGVEFFEARIRPVLVAECYECHSQKKQKGGLRVDSREGVLKGGDSGPAIVPGRPEASLLIRSIRHEDPELKMPAKAPKLEARVIDDFVAWVEMGAPDPRATPDGREDTDEKAWPAVLATRRQRWCFQPVVNPPVPEPRTAHWSEHPIDRFLLEKMEAAGLEPGLDAHPQTVVRRLSFALTGLPPSIQELESFVRDAAINRREAVASAADRLLAQPAFGERWARHWMDMARYSETYGSEHDYLNPHAWQYRDYLVRAFNGDLPYDRFVQEQLAGDLLPARWNAGLGLNEALLGTGWLRMIESYASPVDVKREEASIIDWQIEAMGKSFLGLTIQCARCHDHKFDPISDEDFYALYGVFASTRPVLNIVDEPAKLTRFDGELARLKNEIRTALAQEWEQITASSLESVLREEKKDALRSIRDVVRAGDFAKAWRDERMRQRGGTEGKLLADFTRGDLGGWRVSGPGLPERPAAPGMLSLRQGGSFVRAIQPAGYYSDAISERHGGAIRSPEFILKKGAVSVLAAGSGNARLRLVIENFQNDLLLFSGVNPDLNSASPRWYTMGIKEQWIGRRARVELLTRDDKPCVGEVSDQDAWSRKTDGRSSFGVQKVVVHEGPPPTQPSPLPSNIWQIEPASRADLLDRLASLAQAAARRWGRGQTTDEDARFLQALLEAGALPSRADGPLNTLVAQFRELESQIPQATRAPGVRDDGYAYDSPLFPRGDHAKPGPVVPRRFLDVFGATRLGGKDSGRLALAREITRRDSPLTARVMVNRVWHHLTGRGLVASVDNFGKMGDEPTHPELLDHLATKFMDDGWSVKRLIRYIVTSRAWQLASEPRGRATERDPGNTLLTHARVRRLEAEAIRDAMLAVAGNLRHGYTGPGIRPFYRTPIEPEKQPKPGPIDGSGRRSLYLEARRLYPIEFLATFDAPRPNIFTGQRSQTNVPAQSLALLNDPFVLHQARVWAQRIQSVERTGGDRIRRMYLEAFSRAATAEELRNAAAFVEQAQGDPYAAFAHAIFNMKEFIYLP